MSLPRSVATRTWRMHPDPGHDPGHSRVIVVDADDRVRESLAGLLVHR